MFTATDHFYMSRALHIAERGLYTTSPNPRVGCVIVKNNHIVGEGAHLKSGQPHAEVYAIQQAGLKAKDATAYVTLEPCSHYGRTPPCAEALVQAGIAKVIVAMQDPNPLVAGQGLAYLQIHGIETMVGLMELQAQSLNQGFIARMVNQLPYVRSKIAASLDGKTALANGHSQWITSEHARQDVQHWRAQSCAILTGVGTVLADNPTLNVRDIDIGRQPLRVVVDSYLKTPLNANILSGGNVLIAYADDVEAKSSQFLDAGISLLHAPAIDGKVCLNTLLSHLSSLQVNELMVEAGHHLNGSLLTLGLVNELLLYYAPKLMGGYSQNMFTMPDFTHMDQAVGLDIFDVRQFGKDIRIRAKPHFTHVD
jgi:diaminohydroxyphosphoribosylaminopyrimidine deaminase / 5-amino-6-(5-phosphoribosylamino)uracil reductase